jgi:hypothetical protein
MNGTKPNGTTLIESLGKGLVAGLIGTAAMTVSSTLEQKLRKRPASTAPARATAKVLGIEKFESDAAYNRFSNLSHWGYGTGWGIPRALLRTLGLPPALATAAHGAVLWGAEQVMLPSLDIAPPLVFWTAEDVAIDAWHHAVYAMATGVAYELLDGQASGRSRKRFGII